MDQIKELRSKLDVIDKEIMELLDQRYTITTKIGDIKSRTNISVLDKNREQIILNKTSNYSHSPQIEQVYITIMNESKKLQRK